MALHNPLREAPRLLCEQLLRSVPMTVATVLQIPQLFLEILAPAISLVGVEGNPSRSKSTADCCSNRFDNPHLSY